VSEVEAEPPPEAIGAPREMAWPPEPAIRAAPPRRRRILPLFITGIVVALAVVLGRVMWNAYVVAPWTRDGTVRALL